MTLIIFTDFEGLPIFLLGEGDWTEWDNVIINSDEIPNQDKLVEKLYGSKGSLIPKELRKEEAVTHIKQGIPCILLGWAY